ncbi:MAG: histidinol-phosphatase HisJ family protein [Armatimonadetes bacterium]|nr:histidinol-phosphatase HisJ family protein [Armatimonadota bacterium]
MTTSYHNHTTWSDGTTDVAAMVAAAPAHGLDEIGISDHYVLAPDRRAVYWSMPLDRLEDYIAEVLAVQEGSPVPVRLGVEADFFPGNEADLCEALAPYPFDYVIGSVHYVDGFSVDEAADIWHTLSPAEVDEAFRGYWARVAGLARSGNYDFVGHLDLPKKFGFAPHADLSKEIAAALDAIAAAGLAVEINTAGAAKPCAAAYPAPSLLRECRRRGIPLLINADAHAPHDLTYQFAEAREMARRAGYRQLVRFERRRAIAYPLPES